MGSLILGIETSCDETAAAVLDARSGGSVVLSDVIASQVALHAPNGGVVPEVASRAHLRDIRAVVDEALARAGASLDDISGLAVTQGPGLIGPLLVGTSFAKSVALARALPLVGVHHLEGHVRAAFLSLPGEPALQEPEAPYVALVVSGGHTSLFRIERVGMLRRHVELARSLDDAAGEAYDKVGKLLGLRYPAGADIDRLASGFSGEPVFFPRARIKVDGGRGVTRRAFSFSGIKTSVRQHVQQAGIAALAAGEDATARPDLLAIFKGFQDAVVDMLVTSTLHVLEAEGLAHLVVAGGVSANSLLRARLAEECQRRDIELRIPPPRWSTDNAAMIAAAGALHLAAGERAGLDLSPDPSLRLA